MCACMCTTWLLGYIQCYSKQESIVTIPKLFQREAEILTPHSKALERQALSHIEGRTAHGYKP